MSQDERFLSPSHSKVAHFFIKVFGRSYLSLIEGVRLSEIRNKERLITLLKEFYDSEKRLLILFRHVAKEDAPLLMYAINREVAKEMRGYSPHLYFLYGSDVLKWAGGVARWLFPRIGAIPVQNKTVNKTSLRFIRNELLEGSHPISLAAEGQVTYHMYKTFPITSGAASLAHWVVTQGQECTNIPISIGYRHAKNGEKFCRKVLRKWETLSQQKLSNTKDGPLLSLLLEATDKTLTLIETLYAIKESSPLSFVERGEIICEKVLSIAEEIAHIRGEGTFLERLFTLRSLSPSFSSSNRSRLHKSFAKRVNKEIELSLIHSQLVNALEYLDPSYIETHCSIGRAVEYALLLVDLLNRLLGGNINTRFSPKGKLGALHIGSPIEVTLNEASRKAQINVLNKTIFESLQHSSSELEQWWESKKLDC